MSDFSFKRKEKLRKPSEFIKTYKKGVKKESRHFKISILPNNLQWRRLGLTVSKKIGNSVQRNYVKRRLREYYRQHTKYLPESCDIVLTAKPGAAKILYADICMELNNIFSPGLHDHDK